MKIQELATYLHHIAPQSLQESYDNTGLLVGDPNQEVHKAMISLDVTEEVIDEAITSSCDLIIAHHPLIFKGLKKIDLQTATGKMISKLIRKEIAVFAIHTNLDNVLDGVNGILAEKLGLKQLKILAPKQDTLFKLVVFCPSDHVEKVRQAVFSAGAGHIGNYDSCSFNSMGYGTFKASEHTNPFVGQKGELHQEQEVKIETIVPVYLLHHVVTSMLGVHPYEEVAYDIYPLANQQPNVGAGIMGVLEKETDGETFLKFVKKTLGTTWLKHSAIVKKPVKRVALCGGSGSFLIHKAHQAGADVFITSDIKYHDFFDFAGEMTIVDAGHYETEQFAKELLFEKLKGKFPNFALQISNTVTNPIKFL